MNYAQSLLETVFGGLRPAARALNKPASTIQSWQESGTIPQKHWAEIIQKSAALGHDLTVEDFIDDDLFTAKPTPKGDNQDGHKGDINPTSNPKIPPKTANEMLNFAGYDFNKLHCLTIADFHRVDIETLLQLGSHYLDLSVQKSPRKGPLKGKTLINLFFENSTRTEKSFELAGKRLGADVISMQVASSSVKKGETLLDTASTLNAMNPDLLVVRHSASGAPALLAQKLSCGVINAGDGLHAHPTQALLDALTLRQTLKALGKGDIGGLRIAICGDILHSRVARSNVQLFNMLGAQIHLIAPPTLMPLGAQNWGVNIFHTMKEGLEGCDIIMMLRLQLERMHGAFVPSKREYFHYHGLTRDKLAYANKDVLVMHPGPMNRGVEISSDIADDPQISLITRQVEAGVAMRMAILHALSNAQDRSKNTHISGKG